ncbi:ABC transporter substrate-binding protein [Breznakiella homolactica]|uniref:Sugar ABC transporter substrate-binding protein n=1 Tax=Breznakiella homolactica TaxID=2798577 RepID=A0A7T8B9Q4_9SPIR|nr:sugar ABC transporter substrate-binding protein [Breznakiella homolactica]QQO08195.1 sugar ABC transporter substrate-binding protein [Breznakiella homolactica]
MVQRKFAAVLLLLTVFAGVFVFAGGGQDGGAKVINFWYWDQNGMEVYKQLISEFESQNPGIKINPVVTPWADYWTKLQTALPTGTGPDVFWLNHPNAVSYLPTGLVMDLESAANDIHFENFARNFYEPFMYQGKRYGVPIFYDATVLYYNKALFDKAGVAYPTGDWTWDDFYDAARRLTIKQGNRTIQYGVVIDISSQSGYSNFVLQNGGRIFSDDRMKCIINSPESIEAIQRQLDVIHKNGWAPTIQEMQETTKATLFQSGTAAMITHHSGIVKQYAEILGKDLNVAPLPRQKQRASIYHNIAYVGSAKTKYPEEVRKFLAFLATKRHAEVLSNVWAPCYNGTTELFYAVYDWMDTHYISEAIEYGYPLPIAGRNAGPIYTMMDKEMSKIYTGTQVTSEVLGNFEKIINAEIAK